MVSTLTTLMDLLLQYREIEDEEDPGNRMSCIVNLLVTLIFKFQHRSQNLFSRLEFLS